MRIATFNINNVVRRLPNLIGWLAECQPDVACLQELKATDGAFPIEAIEKAGYGAVWKGQRTWNGVAILARGCEPITTRTALPGDRTDDQARYIEAAVNGVVIASIYLPNGNPRPGPKFVYKMAWFERLLAHSGELLRAGVPAVLAGDYNVVPTDSDIYSAKSWKKDALLQPEPREAYARMLREGWTDGLARIYRGRAPFTFWPYLRKGAWERDHGLRIDHLLVSPALEPRLADAGVDSWTGAEEGHSDHAPAWIELDD